MDPDLQAWAPPPRAATPAVALPGYSDFRLVAHGGEGTVYRARQDGLGRDVAVKVLTVTDPETVARFRRELEITVRLGRQHPHIVTVLDTGAVDGRPCIVMEFHDLGSLHDRLTARGPLPVADVVAAGIAVADALAFAHGQGILHRDVKPQNVLVLPTSYVLADFGIARGADAGHSASLGLVSYRHAAPQVVDGQPPSVADDVWSLGSTLFTLLDGRPPFDDGTDSMLAYLQRVRSGQHRPLPPDVPPALAAIVLRCLRPERADRFPDAASLRAALSAVPLELSTVDPDHTVAVVPAAAPSFPEGPTELPDFGPRPVVEEQADPAEPDPVRTWTEDLADLTVRHHDRPLPVPPPAPAALVDLPEPPPRRRRRTPWLLGGAAVAAGLVIGLVVNLRHEDHGAAPPSAAPSTGPSSTAPSSAAPTSVAEGGDPKYAPVLKPLDDDGSSIGLTWTDPTGGKAQFVVVDVTTGTPKPLVTVAAGATTHRVENLDPSAPKYCFQLIAIGLDDPSTQRGASPKTCTTRGN
ncbi:protein kinase [Actinosynnema sp. NPDC020468]|uniref:serine/threonine-protein kinase n=1 Tax=Actinosynnema sp. NPDC020468 TaxID=3154488 RepID=UPI0033E9E533